jgi:hypothetical protein
VINHTKEGDFLTAFLWSINLIHFIDKPFKKYGIYRIFSRVPAILAHSQAALVACFSCFRICFGAYSPEFVIAKAHLFSRRKTSVSKDKCYPSLTGLSKEIGQLNPLQEQGSPLGTEAETIRSVPITQKLITILDLKDKQDNPLKIKQFLAQLTVSPIENTDILQVSYRTHLISLRSCKPFDH